jgi:hypothetical protein
VLAVTRNGTDLPALFPVFASSQTDSRSRLRISLGLKPLALPGSAPAPEDKDEVARKNFEQHKEKLKQEADAAELAKRIEK